MKVIGIIAEYNPFHNGHLYQINKIKELYPDSIIIVLLNGYFSERGTISVLSKEDKTKIALENNVDIVLEMPFVYGTQASDIFGFYGVKILNEYKIDTLVFGSESNDMEFFNKVVDIELSEEFKNKLNMYLDSGLNYPTAMNKALGLNEMIDKPNDLLAISYIKAVRSINPKIECVSIKRTNDYHDLSLDEKIVSASNIRERLLNGEDVGKYIPYSYPLLKISNDKLFNLLKFKILTDKDLSIYLDVDEGIEYRILKVVNQSKSFDELVFNIKSKRYTYNKIARMLLHILVGLTKTDNDKIKLDYIKILGFNDKGQNYLKSIRKEVSIPNSPSKESLLFKYELKSAYLFEQAIKGSLNDFDRKNIPIKRDTK